MFVTTVTNFLIQYHSCPQYKLHATLSHYNKRDIMKHLGIQSTRWLWRISSCSYVQWARALIQSQRSAPPLGFYRYLIELLSGKRCFWRMIDSLRRYVVCSKIFFNRLAFITFFMRHLSFFFFFLLCNTQSWYIDIGSTFAVEVPVNQYLH